jgi:putative transposase
MAYTRLRYHVVTATHKRRRIITQAVEEIIFAVIPKRAEELGGRILKLGGIDDHIHFVVAVPPIITVADFVGEVKAESSRAVNRSDVLDEEFKWQRSYGAFTCNPMDMQRILEYVADQKRHHAKGMLWPEFEKIRE